MRISLLDAVRLHDGPDDRAVAVPGRRAQVALTALALAGRALTAAQLAEVLWPEGPPTTWQTALRVVVRDLRRAGGTVAPQDGATGTLLILTTPAGYRLAPEIGVDIADLAARTDRAAALLEDDPGRAAALVDPVTASSGARLLPGEDADWLVPHRDRLDAVGLRATMLAARAASATDQHERAVALATDAVGRAPLDEQAHRTLLSVLAARGDRAAVVEAYERCRTLLADELGIDPSPETVELYLAALGTAPRPARQLLPDPPHPLHGRQTELARLRELLTPGAVVTLTGPRGVGKSRLAVEAARSLRGRLPVAWAPLVTLAQDELVAGTVAAALGLSPGAADPTATVATQLATDGRGLLVLDGADAVLDGAAALATAVHQAAPATTVLLTATRATGVAGEVVLPVGPLPVPDADADLAALQRIPTVALLRERATLGGRALQLDARTGPAVLAVCARTGGIPLAVELAAAQLAVMAPGDLADQLEVLAADDGPDERVRTFARQALAQLDPAESTVFRLLGLLGGPVPVPFLRGVLTSAPGSQHVAPLRLPRVLRELTDRHLALLDADGPHWSYDLDDELRALATDLAATDEQLSALAAAVTALRALLPDDPGTPPERYADALAPLRATLRTVQARGADDDADPELRDAVLDLTFRLHRWYAATDVTEGRYWLRRSLAATAEHAGEGRAAAAFALGYLSYWAGDVPAAGTELATAVELLEGRSSPYRARALIYLAGIQDDEDRADEAIATIRLAIDAAAPFGTGLQVAAAMGVASLLAERGDPEAGHHVTDALALCRIAGTPEQLAATLPTAAMISWQVGALAEARSQVEEAFALLDDTPRIARVVALSTAAGIALASGDTAAAARAATAADELGTMLGVERELPHIRSLRALALLPDDPAAAAGVAAGALRAAAGVGEAASALPLQVAATVLARCGGDPELVRAAPALAAAVRRRGSRPLPAPLRGLVATGEPAGEVTGVTDLRDRLLAALAAVAGTTDGAP